MHAPRTAIDQIMREFNADTLIGFREAFSAVLQSSLGEQALKAWPVGGVKLSQRLYQNAQAVSATAKTIIEQHLKGLHNAQELRKALYEGYNFQKDPLDIIKPLPKYLQVEFDKFKAAQLKTPALRAAYLEAIRKAEAGAGMDAIEKQLRIAFYERNRYFANRIARTELHRAYTDQQARELMEQDHIQYVQIRLSSKHPKTDICDYHAKVDLYGLGPGVYPKAEAPKPPFHPHCLPGDSLITASGRITAVSKRRYDGDLVVITTASGQQLAATINHPVLTLSGWVAIGKIQLGDQVFCRVGSERAVAGNDQHQNMPARIADIADSFFGSRQVAAREVPTTAEDFHGDGMAGQIAIIGADCQLWDRFDSINAEALEDHSLIIAHQSHPLLGDSITNLCLKALGLSAHRRMSGMSPLLAKFGRSLGILQTLGFAVASRLDSVQPQAMIYNDPADFHFLSETQNGTSGGIFSDNVIRIDIQSWHGDVYNLETEPGHYTSTNIITHNCYCLTAARIDLIHPKPRFNPKAERAFLSSLPAKEAAQVAGSYAKLQQVLKGGETLKNIYNTGKDPLYQWKRVGDMEEATKKRDRLVEQARNEVVEHGRKTGNERLVLLDARTGETLDAANGIVDKLILTDAMKALIQDANNSICLIHNHPGSSSFSKEDIRAASLPGADRIEAIGHDGSRYKTKPKVTNYAELGAKITAAQDVVMGFLSDEVSAKRISLDAAGLIFLHIINLVLAKSGVIDYDYQLSSHQKKIIADSEIDLDKIIDKAVKKLKVSNPFNQESTS